MAGLCIPVHVSMQDGISGDSDRPDRPYCGLRIVT
jgi:hypothetical protein